MLRDRCLIPLSQQHHNGLALCVLTRRGLAEDASGEKLARLAKRIVDRFEIELVNHFEIEEQVLFPLCGGLPIVAQLIAEHRAMEGLVGRIRREASASLMEEFCSLLSAHIRREERELFEVAQQTLDRAVLDAAGAEIDRRVVRVCL